MISFNRYLATFPAFSVQVRKASTHPEKVQTNTNRYLHPQTHGISVKSTKVFKRSSTNALHLRRCPWPLPGVVFGT
jgi:hypothetical protein